MKLNRKIIINKLNKINAINSEVMLFEIKNRQLIFRTYNEYIKLQCYIALIEEKDNQYVINSRILFTILSKLKNDEVEFNFVDDQLVLHSNQTTLNLNVLNKDEFRLFNLKINKGDHEIPLTLSDLNNLNQFVVPYCAENLSTSSHLTNTNCVNLATNNNQELFAYGTDYKRIVSYKLLERFGQKVNLIIYAKCFGWITKVFNTANTKLKVYLNENSLTLFDQDDFMEVSLMQLVYPNVESVIDDVDQNVIKVNVNELSEALDRGLVITKADATLVVCDFDGNDLLLSFKNSEKGYVSEIIKIENIKGEMSSFCINVHYLLVALKNINTETVYFSMEDSLSALYLYAQLKSNLLQVILPTKNIYN